MQQKILDFSQTQGTSSSASSSSSEIIRRFLDDYNGISRNLKSLGEIYAEERQTQLVLEQEEAIGQVCDTIHNLLHAGVKCEGALDENELTEKTIDTCKRDNAKEYSESIL